MLLYVEYFIFYVDFYIINVFFICWNFRGMYSCIYDICDLSFFNCIFEVLILC